MSTSEGTEDPAIAAIIVFIQEMCRLAVAEATGFYSASVLSTEREVARAAFVNAMNRAVEP